MAHVLAKKATIPEADLARAMRRKRAFEMNPDEHSFAQELEDDD